MGEPVAAVCEAGECDWLEIADGYDECRVLMVLHFVVKHPNRYHLLTVRDPEAAQRQYADQIERYKERL